MEEIFKNFFGADTVKVYKDGTTVDLVFRGVSPGNFKEFFTARLVTGEEEENIEELRKARARLDEFEEGSWENQL